MTRRRALLAAPTGALLLGFFGLYACGGDDAPGSSSSGASGGGDANLSPDGAPIGDAAVDRYHPDGTTYDGGPCARQPEVAGGDPLFVGAGGAKITIRGANFEAVPLVALKSGSTEIPLVDVVYNGPTTITAKVPAAPLPGPGSYDLVVTNPDGCFGLLPGFKAIAGRVPSITRVSPDVVSQTQSALTTVRGCNFPAGAQVATVSSAGAQVTHAGTASCTGAATCADGSAECTWTGTIAGSGLAPGGHVLRVIEPASGIFGEYGPFGVATADGSLTGGFAPIPPMRVARRSHASVVGRIDDKQRFLYAFGGEPGSGVPTSSVDVAPIDRFGGVRTFFEAKNPMATARSGLAGARFGSYLYAIGGTQTTQGTYGVAPKGAPIALVERARVLDPAAAPRITKARVLPGEGVFPKGSFYYRVSARGLADGESLPSEEIVVLLADGDAVELTWTPVPGATGYTIYRSPTELDPLSTSRRVQGQVDAPTTTFVDPGSVAFIKNEYTMPLGSTSTWRPQSSLVSPRFGARAVVATDPVGATFLYVLGGWGVCPGGGAPGPMNCYEYAPIDPSTGDLGVFKTGAQRMLAPRFRFGADAIVSTNTPGIPTTSVGIVVAGGKGASGSGATVEVAQVTAGGELSAFVSVPGFAPERDGAVSAVGDGFVFTIGGGLASNIEAGDFPTYLGSTSRSSRIQLGSPFTLGAFTTLVPTLPVAVGLHSLASDSAFFYVLGGSTDDQNAIDNAYAVVY